MIHSKVRRKGPDDNTEDYNEGYQVGRARDGSDFRIAAVSILAGLGTITNVVLRPATQRATPTHIIANIGQNVYLFKLAPLPRCG